METLKMMDGTVLEGHILESGNGRTIFVYINNMSVVDGVTIFANRAKTGRIIATNHEAQHIYEGYTHLYAASNEFGNCNIVMEKEQ